MTNSRAETAEAAARPEPRRSEQPPCAIGASQALGTKGRHRRHANPFAVRGQVEPLDLSVTYGVSRPLALDIGCGPGAFVASLAQLRPNMNVLGLEIRGHLVAAGNARIAAAGLPNAHVALGNANTQAADLLQGARLSLVTINFPDPWFKLRHRKRRVLTPAFATWLAERLVPGGQVHLMTDVQDLAVAMRQVLAKAGLVDLAPGGAWATASTTGAVSEREAWHLGQGDPIWRAAFERHSCNQRLAPT